MLPYPIKIDCEKNGNFRASAVDFLEVEALGGGQQEVVDNLQKNIEKNIMYRIARNLPIPSPSSNKEPRLYLSTIAQAKIYLYWVMQEKKIKKTELAKMLKVQPSEITRLFDIRHQTSIEKLQQAFKCLGRTLEINLR